MEYRFQLASDVVRDGLGLELHVNGNVLAEVFRCDADNSLTVSVYAEDVPFIFIEKLLRMALEKLGEYEDGTALPRPIT